MFFLCSRAHEEAIAGKITVEGGQATLSPDPQASLRTELLGQLAAAQLALESAIADLSRTGSDSGTLAAIRMQLSSVAGLMSFVGSAPFSRLSEMRSEIAATAANAVAFANQASGDVGNATDAAETLSPAQRARVAIESVRRDLFENHVLDPYLQFASPEDEEAYRKRERERREEIGRALASGTPEGMRRAAELTHHQLRDADAHGAGRSPDFAGMQQRANAALMDLQPANSEVQATGQQETASSTDDLRSTETDNGIGEILATLKAAGVTTPADQASDAGHGVNLDVAQARDVVGTIRQS